MLMYVNACGAYDVCGVCRARHVGNAYDFSGWIASLAHGVRTRIGSFSKRTPAKKTIWEISKISSELRTNSSAMRMEFQRTAGQGDAKAHYKTHRGAFGAPRRRKGRLGLRVLLRFRLALASRALQVHALFPEPPERKKYLACAGRLPHANYSFPTIIETRLNNQMSLKRCQR